MGERNLNATRRYGWTLDRTLLLVLRARRTCDLKEENMLFYFPIWIDLEQGWSKDRGQCKMASTEYISPRIRAPAPGEPSAPPDTGEPHVKGKSPSFIIFWLTEHLLSDVWKVTVWPKKKKKCQGKKLGGARGPVKERGESSHPSTHTHTPGQALPSRDHPFLASWCFPLCPRPGPWPQTCSEWGLSWKHLCRCYSDKTLILSPPLLPLLHL